MGWLMFAAWIAVVLLMFFTYRRAIAIGGTVLLAVLSIPWFLTMGMAAVGGGDSPAAAERAVDGASGMLWYLLGFFGGVALVVLGVRWLVARWRYEGSIGRGQEPSRGVTEGR